jgi:predicted nucleotidyltransferase
VAHRSLTPETIHLRALAERLTDTYLRHCGPCAVLLVGSAASGDADEYSDVDLIVYYDRVPPADTIARAAAELSPGWYRATPWSDESGEEDQDGLGERYGLDGVECQVAHVSVGAFEREIKRVVDGLELDEELLKIMSGLFEGRALAGEERIEEWRGMAAYRPELQRALIAKRWKLFPWWYFQERLRRRDSTVWRHDVLVQSAYAIVGALAALNCVYFSTFEFKRSTRFLSRLELAPSDLAKRLDSLFELSEPESTAELERLVEETQALVAAHLPDVDMSIEWAGRSTNPGEREVPWS